MRWAGRDGRPRSKHGPGRRFAYALQSTTIRGRGFGNRAFGFTCVLRTSPRTRTTRACPARITAALRLTTQPRQRAPVKVTVVVSVHRPSRTWSESHWAFTKKSPFSVETTSDVTAGVPSWQVRLTVGRGWEAHAGTWVPIRITIPRRSVGGLIARIVTSRAPRNTTRAFWFPGAARPTGPADRCSILRPLPQPPTPARARSRMRGYPGPPARARPARAAPW